MRTNLTANSSAARQRIASVVLALAFSTALALVGCKGGEARSTGFTQSAQMHHDPHLPFHKVWRKPGIDFRSYTKLYVADVNTDYMFRQTDWQKGERKEQIQADLIRLGAYTKRTIEKAFRDDPEHRFEVLTHRTTQPAVLQLEVALTEVVPSKVVLNAAGYAPFGIGTAVNAVRMIGHDQSSVAFEARVRDAATGEVVAMAADREVEQFAPISVRGLTWYSHAEAIIAQWSGQFVQALDLKPGKTLRDSDTITLQPW